MAISGETYFAASLTICPCNETNKFNAYQIQQTVDSDMFDWLNIYFLFSLKC